jgi:SAM-dependent methyltransferase
MPDPGVFERHHARRGAAARGAARRGAAARDVCRAHNRVKSQLFEGCQRRFRARATRGIRVLEVGCGTSSDWPKWGRVPVELFCGYDVSPAAVAECARRYPSVSRRGPHYTVASACSARDRRRLVDTTGGCFDVVTCTFALNHCFGTDGGVAMDHLCQLCAPEGEVVAIFPERAAVLHMLRDGPVKTDVFEMRRTSDDHSVVFHQYGSTPCMVEPTLAASRVRAELRVRGFDDFLVDAPLTDVASSGHILSQIHHVLVARRGRG